MTSDAGALLLGAADRAIGLVDRFASCFTDYRAADLVEHTVASLVGQRVYGIALGYEDLIDHECQLDLYADRTSAHTMRANQLRLWFAAMAYILISALRRIALIHTQFAAATCGTIRLALLKIGARVRISLRRVHLAMASGCPWQDEFRLAHARLAGAAC
jgi:Transposase DDE domain group 1